MDRNFPIDTACAKQDIGMSAIAALKLPTKRRPRKFSHPLRGTTVHELSVTYLPIGEIRPSPRNARKHPKRQRRLLEASIEAHGFVIPIIISPQNEVVCGHARLQAAKALGLKIVPTIRIEHLSEEQLRTLRLADNRLAELSSWDGPALAIELQSLSECSLDFDLEVTGFETGEIDFRIAEHVNAVKPDKGDVPPPPRSGLPITRAGDTWVLGRHRIHCGNVLDPGSLTLLMGGELASMIFIDPPYNVPIDGHASGLGSISHREFAMGSGEMTPEEFTDFLKSSFAGLIRYSKVGSMHFICMDWRHLSEVLAAGYEAYGAPKNLCVWVKDNPGMGSFYRSQHELILVFKNGQARHRNNIQLGKFGRNRTNVWTYPCANSFRRDEGTDLLATHPTVKPVALVADAILDCTSHRDIVLDTFLGSGTTLIAAERTGRRCFGLEIDPAYVDATILRWQSLTDGVAFHAETKCSFEDELKSRKQENDHA